MAPTQVTYTRRNELGGPGSSEEVSVTVAINQNGRTDETADQAFRLAKKFCLSKLETPVDPLLAKHRRIVEDPDEYSVRELRQAEAYIAALPPPDEGPIL